MVTAGITLRRVMGYERLPNPVEIHSITDAVRKPNPAMRIISPNRIPFSRLTIENKRFRKGSSGRMPSVVEKVLKKK